MALGLAVMSAIAVRAGEDLDGREAVVERVGAALTGGSVLLAVALLVVLVVLVPGRARPSRQVPVPVEEPGVRAAA
jgi:hypothetical protein